MNRKNITFVLAGLLLATFELNLTIGHATIDIANNIPAFVLFFLGLKNLAGRNKSFNRAKRWSVIGIAASVIVQVVSFIDFGSSAAAVTLICSGINTFLLIYTSYYFNDGLVLESTFQDKSAVTRSLNGIWSILGILIFVNYMVSTMNVARPIKLVVTAIAYVYAVYYCYYVNSLSRQLYMEEIPTAHME